MIGSDYGARPGSYIYQLRYDMPDLPEMADHVHSIPMDAIAHLLMENDSDDAGAAASFFVREAVTSVAQAVSQRSGTGLLASGDPREKVARLRGAQRVALDATVEAAVTDPTTLDTALPLLRRYGVDRQVTEEAASLVLDRSMTKPTEVPVPSPAAKFIAARQSTGDKLLATPDAHIIDTSTQGWQDMIGLLGEHKTILRQTQVRSFDARYQSRIMQITDKYVRGSH
jgi:hypothetical protein